MWSPFLEKMYAKVLGTYEYIDNYSFAETSDAFNFLLGVPTETFYVDNYCYYCDYCNYGDEYCVYDSAVSSASHKTSGK